jgi:ATP-dependent RNA helicase DDX6/DHH1
MGKDIIARAKNGTGKTGSYVIPILERSDFTNNFVQAVILVPTRELALQVSADIRELGKYLNVQCIICTGGTNIKDDIYRLNNPVQVIVGTPGRIYDLASKNALDLSRCNMLALDEADKLLSQDFQQILENIIDFMPGQRQIMLVSATFPINVKSFKDKYLRNAVMKNLMEELTLFGLTQYYTYLKEKLKLHCLHTLFQKVSYKNFIYFILINS